MTAHSARRIARQTIRSERLNQGGGPPSRPRYPILGGGEGFARLGKVGATTIPGMDTATRTPGQGAGTLWVFSGTSFADDIAATFFNPWTGPVDAGATVILVDVNGFWFVVGEECTTP